METNTHTTDEKTEHVKQLHTQIVKMGKDSIVCAIACGNELEEIKSTLPHGQWSTWCKENTGQGFSVETMRRYMRLATESKSVTSDFFDDCDTLTDAYNKFGILGRGKTEPDKQTTDETEPPAPKKDGATETEETEPKENEFLKLIQLRMALLELINSNPDTRLSLIGMLEPLVELYNVEHQETEPVVTIA